jgi:hypothetical protein
MWYYQSPGKHCYEKLLYVNHEMIEYSIQENNTLVVKLVRAGVETSYQQKKYIVENLSYMYLKLMKF